MISFKTFLTEGYRGFDRKRIDVSDIKQLLNGEFSNCKYMFNPGSKLIFRGDSLTEPYYLLDLNSTVRTSQNTSNYYTSIFDNHPDYKAFPKRSKSLICSVNSAKAGEYGRRYVVIPSNKTKIGVVGRSDIWDIRVYLFEMDNYLDRWNAVFKELGVSDKGNVLENLREFAELIQAGDADAVEALNDSSINKRYENIHGRSIFDDYKDSFYDEILKGYSIENTEFTAYNSETIKHNWDDNTEIWLDGKLLLIDSHYFFDTDTLNTLK